MKATELIEALNKLIRLHGDLPIELHCKCNNVYDNNEVKEVSYTIYGKYSNKSDRKCFTLLDFIQ